MIQKCISVYTIQSLILFVTEASSYYCIYFRNLIAHSSFTSIYSICPYLCVLVLILVFLTITSVTISKTPKLIYSATESQRKVHNLSNVFYNSVFADIQTTKSELPNHCLLSTLGLSTSEILMSFCKK